MSVLVASKDIYLSTQQSGAPGTTDQVFSRFRMCLNTNPLVCDNTEQTRLSVTQFNSPRQFYDIHQYNNRFDIFFNANPTTTAADGANHRPDPQIGSFQLTCRDYDDIQAIKQEFPTRLQAQLILMLEIANINGAAQPGYVNVAVSPQQLGNSDRILEVSITGTAITDNHLENLVIQTPQRHHARRL